MLETAMRAALQADLHLHSDVCDVGMRLAQLRRWRSVRVAQLLPADAQRTPVEKDRTGAVECAVDVEAIERLEIIDDDKPLASIALQNAQLDMVRRDERPIDDEIAVRVSS